MLADAGVLASTAATSAAVVFLIRRNAERLPQSQSTSRSLHEGAVPQAGGLAILAGIAVAWIASPPPLPGTMAVWLAAFVAIAVISFVDDVRGVSPWVRLAFQIAAAAWVASQIMDIGASPPTAMVFVLAIVWGANLFNFMDGNDGLAASMAIVGFACYAAAAALRSAPWLGYAVVGVAALPFLAVNRPRASMFMGDVGAVPLGFLAAALGAAGFVRDMWPAWFPVLVFLPFIADATVTLALRLVRGEAIWRAHRSHFYQRLNALGADHRGTLAVYAAMMLACAALAIATLALFPRHGATALAVAAVVHAAAFAVIGYHSRNNKTLDNA
ncbi:MAG TPA: UDP-phosphate N-acetylglucosaminyl 1-phosphate transferase [Casimicrobiaceae bacterium]|nr:UDP-phosphate N-acetylglucosaminyl 1-phosphate transferase [Casimicrobiaceae bacterium]